MEDLLRALVAFPTVTGDFGANDQALKFIDSYLRTRGLHTESQTFNGYQNLFASTSASKTPKVLLAAHLDVVPGPESMFEMQAKDGKLYGRGVFDMKFSIAAYMQAVDELKDELDTLDFGIMITPDEEVGSANGVPRMLDAGYVPTDVCVLPDGADGQNWDIETFAKGAWFAEFSAEGIQAHGSRPWNGDNAIDKLLGFITELKAVFPPVAKEASTINLGQITGGQAINQVPGFAQVSVDMRYPTIEEKDRIHTAVLSLCKKHDIKSSDIMLINPVTNDFQNPYLQTFATAVHSVTGVTSKPWGTPAGTDARFFAEKGLPVIVCVPPGGSHHSDGEWIDLNGFLQYKDVVVDFLRRSAKKS